MILTHSLLAEYSFFGRILGNFSNQNICFRPKSEILISVNHYFKGVDFVSYDVDIMTEENYKPAYVAMRNLGRENRDAFNVPFLMPLLLYRLPNNVSAEYFG